MTEQELDAETSSNRQSMKPSGFPGETINGVSSRFQLPSSSTSQNMNGNTDLYTFLHEIGTSPKEARYWLREFQRNTKELVRPFAVVQVEREVLTNEEMRDKLLYSLSFIHRNGMKCVLTHGTDLAHCDQVLTQDLQDIRSTLAHDSHVLIRGLEEHSTPARLFYAGSDVLGAQQHPGKGLFGNVSHISSDTILWALESGHMPVIQGLGVTPCGQILGLDVNETAAELAKVLIPLKVLFVNTTGGYTDEDNEVVANINLPGDLENLKSRSWFTPQIKGRVEWITDLLQNLPEQSAVVVTAANTLLTELFSHNGSGTFFKIPEPIEAHSTLEHVDIPRLRKLMEKAFRKNLRTDYFDTLADRLETLYLSTEYNAAAIVTKECNLSTPYLDKFAVTVAKQSHGMGDQLWNCIKRDYKNLFWRSKYTNAINNWYFQKSSAFLRECSGSWSNGQWMVFWFGVQDQVQSSKLIEFALQKPSTFTE